MGLMVIVAGTCYGEESKASKFSLTLLAYLVKQKKNNKKKKLKKRREKHIKGVKSEVYDMIFAIWDDDIHN